MPFITVDIETDGLNPSKIHVCCVKVFGTDKVIPIHSEVEFHLFCKDHPNIIWVAHNGLTFDFKVLNKLWNAKIDLSKVIDTHVVSRLIDYKRFNTHSLEELGDFLKIPKSEYTGGWEEYSIEMEEYCIQDVEVCEAVFKFFLPQIKDPIWKKALRVEHDMAVICDEMQDTGFHFDVKEAEVTLQSVKEEMSDLEASFLMSFPPKLVESKRIKFRTKKDGTLFSNVSDAITSHPKVEMVGDELICYEYKSFNPGSPIDRIDALWEAGWKPFEMTKGHKKWLREQR